MSLERVIELARGELGYTENPANSNNTKYGAAYGLQGQPWCVIFLWWLFREAGESAAFFGGAKTASCGTLLRWYREQGQTVPVSEVQPGDIVILNFSGTKETQHCGLVVDYSLRVSPKTGAPEFVVTIEGNTTPGLEGSQDNGGSVALKNRDFWNIVAVCRPKYSETPPPAAPEPPQEGAKDDITGHWAEEAIRWCMEAGLMQGYEDGTFQPDKGVTRAELATVLRRLVELEHPVKTIEVGRNLK